MAIEQQLKRFTSYDIFSTFLPGSILLIGVFGPITGLQALFTDLSVGGFLILIILSFAGGLGLQAIGSYISSVSGGFSKHMDSVKHYRAEGHHECEEQGMFDRIRYRMSRSLDSLTDYISPCENESGGGRKVKQHYPSPIGVTDVDFDFLHKCRYKYDLPRDFASWDRLFKFVLTDLESRNQSRALRLQALYLGLRGMVISTLLLGLYFSILLILEIPMVLETNIISVLAILSFVLSMICFTRQREFRNSVLEYMIVELCILVDLPTGRNPPKN